MFQRLLSEDEAMQMQKEHLQREESRLIALLEVDYMKIEACLFPMNGTMVLGYDVFVKDDPASQEWICYESIDGANVPACVREEGMLAILDRVVQENELSYTECCFEKLDGKNIDKKKDMEVQING